MKKILFLITLFATANIFSIYVKQKGESAEQATDTKQYKQYVDNVIEKLKEQSRLSFGIGDSKFNLKNFNRDKRDSWNGIVDTASNIVKSSSVHYLSCLGSKQNVCTIDNPKGEKLTSRTIFYLNQSFVTYIDSLIQQLKNGEQTKFTAQYIGAKNNLLKEVTNIKTYLKNLKIDNNLQNSEALRALKALLDIYEKLAKKIEQDFAPEFNKFIGKGSKGPNADEIIKEINDRFENFFNKSGIPLKEKRAIWKSMLGKVMLFVISSGSEKLYANFMKQNYYVYNLIDYLEHLNSQLNEFKEDSSNLEKIVNFASYKEAFTEGLNLLRKEINKVWTFYSADQRDAKKLLLHFVDTTEKIFNAYINQLNQQFKSTTVKTSEFGSPRFDRESEFVPPFELPAYGVQEGRQTKAPKMSKEQQEKFSDIQKRMQSKPDEYVDLGQQQTQTITFNPGKMEVGQN